MGAEATIQAMFDHYPNLYQERSECLNYLFIVVDNDFFWIDGKLVDSDLKPYRSKMGHKAQQNKKSEKEYDKVLRKYPRELRWNEVTKDSYIVNYPKDIQDDWMKLINETKRMLRKDGVSLKG